MKDFSMCSTFFGWHPDLNQDGKASAYKEHLRSKVADQKTDLTAEFLEELLGDAANKFGSTSKENLHFKPSAALREMRARRRSTPDASERKSLSFDIRKRLRQETRAWRSSHVNELLNQSARWKHLKTSAIKVVRPSVAPSSSGRRICRNA